MPVRIVAVENERLGHVDEGSLSRWLVGRSVVGVFVDASSVKPGADPEALALRLDDGATVVVRAHVFRGVPSLQWSRQV